MRQKGSRVRRALVFGYMLSGIGSLISALDRQAALSEEKMEAIKEYMRWRRLPRELTIRMRRYYEYFYEECITVLINTQENLIGYWVFSFIFL